MADFPEDMITALQVACLAQFGGDQTEVTDFAVVKRPLRPSDPDRSIGIFPVDWGPVEGSHEMGHATRLMGGEPTLNRYNLRVHLLVKQIGDEEEARATFSRETKNLRAMLYRDPDLAVALRLLSESELGVTERVTRWGVTNQRYLGNEVTGRFMFLSTTNLWVETES